MVLPIQDLARMLKVILPDNQKSNRFTRLDYTEYRAELKEAKLYIKDKQETGSLQVKTKNNKLKSSLVCFEQEGQIIPYLVGELKTHRGGGPSLKKVIRPSLSIFAYILLERAQRKALAYEHSEGGISVTVDSVDPSILLQNGTARTDIGSIVNIPEFYNDPLARIAQFMRTVEKISYHNFDICNPDELKVELTSLGSFSADYQESHLSGELLRDTKGSLFLRLEERLGDIETDVFLYDGISFHDGEISTALRPTYTRLKTLLEYGIGSDTINSEDFKLTTTELAFPGARRNMYGGFNTAGQSHAFPNITPSPD